MSCGHADVRRFALALPEAYEDTHRGRPSFRVEKRIFSMLNRPKPGGAGEGFFAPLYSDRPVASVTVDREDQLNLAAAFPDAFEPAGRYGFSWVWLDEIAPETLEMVLRMSWAHVAPKRLAQALSG